MSGSNCCFSTGIQVSQETGKVVWYSYLLKNFPQFVMIHIVKGFDIVIKAEVDVFLEFSCFFDHPTDVGNLVSGSSDFCKSNLNFWKFMGHLLLKPSLEKFEHYFASVWDECHYVVLWTFFGIVNILWHCLSLGLEWKLTISSPVATAEFSRFADIFSAALSQHLLWRYESAVDWHRGRGSGWRRLGYGISPLGRGRH